jgi:hypothetical protein
VVELLDQAGFRTTTIVGVGSVKRISLVTITKGDLAGLQRTAASVFSQTLPRAAPSTWEWILVDGGCCGSTRQWADDWLQSGWLHACIQEADRGPYDAMAKGARQATGDYLCFLNGGDALAKPHTLERVMALLEQHKPDVLLGWGEVGPAIQASWLAHLPAMRMASLGFCHQAAYYRRELLMTVPFRNARQTDNDTVQLAALIEQGARVVIVGELLASRDPLPGLSSWSNPCSQQSVLATLQESYGLQLGDALAVLRFRRQCRSARTVVRLLTDAPRPGWHPQTRCHLAILCLDTLIQPQAARLGLRWPWRPAQASIHAAAVAALNDELGAAATTQLCCQLHQAVRKRARLQAATADLIQNL